MNIAVFINDDDVFAEHHLAHTPQSMHNLERLIGVLLPDTNEYKIVKHTFRRQRHINDLREVHLEHWQENPNAGVPEVIIFHRGNTDNRRGVDGIAAVSDRGKMEYRVVLNSGVEAGMI